MLVTEEIRTQTELSSYLRAASFASLNDEMNNMFSYMKSIDVVKAIFIYLLNVH
jgi:hypothetical protein